MSRRGICHIWFRGRHISPSMPYREARSVAESSEGPTASKSDRTGRNPGMTRLVRRSSAGVWRYCVFLSWSNIPSAHAQKFWLFDTWPTPPPPPPPQKKKILTCWVFFFFKPAIDISVDFLGINITEEPYVSGLVSDRGERWFHADWDA